MAPGCACPIPPRTRLCIPSPAARPAAWDFRWRGLVKVICLATGAALEAAIGPYRGKGSGGLGLVRQVLGSLHPGDVMLADALYCNYFLIATLIAAGGDVDPRNLSFKHPVQLWTQWVACGLSPRHDSGRLFTLIAQCQVGHRPGRIEPRMRKRGSKPFPWLKTPRPHARRQVQRYRRDWATK